MKQEQSYTDRVNAYLATFLEKEGFALLKTEFVEEDHNWFLRVYIDLTEEETRRRQKALESTQGEKPDAKSSQSGAEAEGVPNEDAPNEDATDEEVSAPGVGINDCAKVSRRLSKWLDKTDFIKEAYTLEVCSKGFLEQADAQSVCGQ